MLAAETKTGADSAAMWIPTARGRPSWKDIVEPVGPFLEQVTERLTEQVGTFEAEIIPYARYALTNQGKHLRPALVFLSGGASGQVSESHVEVAVIIEMVHLATLVHDDIMDEAEIRRRRPTLAMNWGNSVSVLLGDCLFANALRLAASFPTPEICRAVASATNTVCSGEILQTLKRHNFEFSRRDYFRVLEMKTAELFALSCDLGAWLGGGGAVRREGLRQYGLALGTAYQLYDDCLDIFGSEATVGKSLGTDLANGKITLPVLIVLEQGTASERKWLRESLGEGNAGQTAQFMELLNRYDALGSARNVIHDYLGKARESLSHVPDSESRAALVALTHFLAQQTDSLGVS